MAARDDAGGDPGAPSLLQRLKGLPAAVLWALAVLLFLLVWYGVVGGLRAGIAPDPALRAGDVERPAGGSAAVALAARLVERETADRAFTPNDSFLHPTAFAWRTAAFQRAVVETVATLLPVLPAVAGAREPARVALFTEAVRELAVPADRAWLALDWPPIRVPAERRYLGAVRLLREANVAPGIEPTEGAALLAPALAALADTVAEAAAEGEAVLRSDDGPAGRALARQRGVATAAGVLLRGLREDHANAIRQSGRAASLALATDALDRAADVHRRVSVRGGLVESGYALLTAARALDEAARSLG
jgi:hypothetical protein